MSWLHRCCHDCKLRGGEDPCCRFCGRPFSIPLKVPSVKRHLTSHARRAAKAEDGEQDTEKEKAQAYTHIHTQQKPHGARHGRQLVRCLLVDIGTTEERGERQQVFKRAVRAPRK